MTDIYVRALHANNNLSCFLVSRSRDDRRTTAAGNYMLVWDRQIEDWRRVEATTPGLSSLRAHHLDRVESDFANRG